MRRRRMRRSEVEKEDRAEKEHGNGMKRKGTWTI
jgi:hypothetical protein